MGGEVLVSVFANAAMPQKLVLVVLVAAALLVLWAAAQVMRNPDRSSPWRRLISNLRIAGPGLGLLMGAMNGFHMARTIQRLPFDATARQLAPGILEVSTLIGLGAVVGLMAVAAHWALSPTSAAPGRSP
jgi:hypothetical protein